MKRFGLVVAAMLPLFLVSALASPAAPRMTLTSMAKLPVVERTPYDVNANAAAQLDAALARARQSGKRVLVDFGGNWCPDCLVLANVLQLPELKAFVAAHFEVVLVDVGRFDKNTELPARFGVPGRLGAVPSVFILDAQGHLLNRDQILALGDARTMTPQAIADWLAGWAQ
jgi:thiol-disulfide isomerase/thioredoxin